MIRWKWAAVSVLLMSGVAAAQPAMQAKLDEKLKKDFVKKIPWVHDYDEALKLAKEQGKPIFGYFTRSYAP
ncbi:MAG: hypothetical protein AB7O52_16305 [Planctomycetota bacterium]